ncbi:MAG: helix-turn-helix transcriptional regulator [Betaproteobacteria bacterium]|nr:MAG: helix-turn-helix transcriptional regulator [Betaproteobacteria bacterium]
MNNAKAINSGANDATGHDVTDSGFLKAIGARVRKARSERELSRKALSDRSGVSERYLALLESGRGNLSVLLLRQISSALGLTPEALLRDAGEEPAALASVQQMLLHMTPQQLVRARDLLLGEFREDPSTRSTRIALIGLRGAGKTTLGQKLAQALKRPFIELDREIEREAGTSLSEIFLLYGQPGYRRYERRCLEQLLNDGNSCVIAAGGSIVSEPTTYDLLLSACYTIWLKTRPEEHMQRVIAQGDTRPMAGNSQAMDDLRRILQSRVVLYGKADAIVDTAGNTVRESLAQLNQLTKELGQTT